MVINITVDEVKLIQDKNINTVIVDVRTTDEFENGTMHGAINIDIFDPEFMNKCQKLDTASTYLILCKSGNRSGQAAEYLEQMGFKNVCNIIGGMIAWDGKIAYPKAA